MTELEQLKAKIAILEAKIDQLVKVDRYYFGRNLHLSEASSIYLPTSGHVFYNYNDPTGRQDTSGSSGTTMTTGHRYNGNTGSKYYSVGDIVYALKLLGIFKNE
jgi:hypothetical protein